MLLLSPLTAATGSEIHRSQTAAAEKSLNSSDGDNLHPQAVHRSSTEANPDLLRPPPNPNRQSYAHRRSVSGWDRLFTNIEQRAENNADDLNHEIESHDNNERSDMELRVPGLGEETLAHGDVQYVYEYGSDDNQYGAHSHYLQQDALNGLLAHDREDGIKDPRISSSSHGIDTNGVRGRADTGISSATSALQYYTQPHTSTTALSPAYELAEVRDSLVIGTNGLKSKIVRAHDKLESASDRIHQVSIHHSNSQQQQQHPHEEGSKESPLFARILHRVGGGGGSGDGREHRRSKESARSVATRSSRRSSGEDHIAARGLHSNNENDDDDEDDLGAVSGDEAAARHKRMGDLKSKLRRAVIKASVITTRKTQRQMKSAAPQSIFPFLQDAMFVPMFHFMRDEHGHRPPPVIFDAIRLNVVDSGAIPLIEEDHHFAVRIELQYGDVKWAIRRRLNDFLSLHTVLTLRKFQGRVTQLPPFPQQISYAIEKARSFNIGHGHRGGGSERLVQATMDRKQALESYLTKLLRALNMRPAFEVCTFLELSAVSIIKDVGWKGKEGNLDRRVEHTTGMWCTPRDLRRWSRQWVLVRDSFIAFCNHISDPYPSDVLFADPQFDIKFRKKTGHNPLFPYRITISNQYRRIQLRSDSERVINEWRNSIEQMKRSSAWAQPHRFDSFAPIRENSRVIWFVDGDDYFYAVSEALEKATDSIYIEDWWLSPELHLRRPYHLNEEYRLDRLLKRKAEEGVKIYVVVYKEVTVSLTINSAYTKRKLQSLHKNIMVQRHPDHLAGGTMFWAHHEKMVIVDNTFAFIGGLDLCWGRYDTHGHRLADYFLPYKGHPFSHLQIFFGQDYNNARIHDFANVNEYEDTLVNRCTTARMPWHDVHMAMIGQPARDVARHFIQRWNFIKSSKGMAKTHMPFLMPKGEYSVSRNDMQYRGTCRTQVLRSSAEWSMGINKENSIHTAYCEMIRNSKHFIYIENQFFISNAREDPSYTIKNRIAEALVDRIKRAHRRQEKLRIIVIIPLMPAFEGDVNAAGAATLKLVMHWQYQTICRGDHSIAAQLDKEGIDMHQYIRFFGLRTYDVIRRFADGAVKQDISAIAGNAPQEAPGFDQVLKEQGVPVIDRTHNPQQQNQSEPTEQSDQDADRRVELPTPSPLPEVSRAASHPPLAVPSLSFSDSAHPSARTGEYFFQRPDEAFAEDAYPMQDNPARRSQELSRMSQEYGGGGGSSSSQQRQQQQQQRQNRPPMIGRHSFSLARKSLSRQRSSISGGLREFLSGDRSGAASDASSETSSSSSSSPSSSDIEYDSEMANRLGGYSPRGIDNEGRRKTALRYLVRGTEHIKQYGRPRRAKDGSKGLSGGQKLHKKIHKYGHMGNHHHRDSVSEFGGSNMRVDMEDVENYVHPAKSYDRRISQAAFLKESHHDGTGKAANGGGAHHTLLPEAAGTEYMRERQLLDSDNQSPPATNADASNDAGVPAGSQIRSRATRKSIVHTGSTATATTGGSGSNIGRSRGGGWNAAAAAAATTSPNTANNISSFPPPPRTGAQIMEHEVFGAKSAAAADDASEQPRKLSIQPPLLHPQLTAPASLAPPETPAQPKTSTDMSEMVYVEPEVVDQIVSELVYVHCKLMIVDDRYVIMGSANINDRSMVGNRDSEIAMIVEDTEPVHTTMDGRPYQAAKFAHSLRMQLCQEHSGLLESFDQMRYVFESFAGKPPINTKRSETETQEAKRARRALEDPLSDAFMQFWMGTATNNELIFRDIFRCVPDDTIESFDQYKKFIPSHEVPYGHALPSKTTAESLEHLKGVRGHLVPIPLNFLKNENLGAKLGDKEILVPVEIFT
ncbi:hypothetical protein LPJ64_004131 [Coemansia asiatica]|uniref:Phospholipase n=1 Tax=Coemansia asiatica TaxID=1052880 RepID=A0A9W7XJH8_9FUNG|nr:hypothetical protein LPJ64_004131 [Coemansia asiatica]